MARIYPFRAWRYNPSTVRLDDVVTQPNDKVSPAMQQAYYQRSPYNLVRIVLGLPELFDAERGESVYTRAGRDLRAWREQGVLTQEKAPCLFAYTQRFKVPGTEAMKERRGFIALGKLHDDSEQIIFPHEERPANAESSGPSLLNATHAQFGQILMLYSDPAGSIDKILFDDPGTAEIEVSDEYGVLHRLWRVSDPAAIRLLTTAMADKKLIVADGQQTYETALDYSKEARDHARSGPLRFEHNPSELAQPPYPEAAAMMTFVNMDADGLVIQPVGRTVQGLEGFDPVAFAIAAMEFFTVTALAEDSAEGYMELLSRQDGAALVAVTRAGALLFKPKPEAVAEALAEVSERQRQLGLSLLNSIVFKRLLGLDSEPDADLDAETAPGGIKVRYLRDAAEAVEQVRRGQAGLAFLISPVSMEQLREAAFAGEPMPHKSTDFFPKLLSGLAIYALD
jgi:uncharacterized protein (DUF1015 family)